jgi:two-component system, OmpR family, alkaline phosphatase synthesis response regulator PhoP
MTTVLLIDDQHAILEDFAQILTFEGFDVLKANNGVLGAQLAQQHHPDVILCDMNMPGISGQVVRQLLLSHQDTAHIPFAFLTANKVYSSPDGEVYLVKPITSQDLVRAVKRLETGTAN